MANATIRFFDLDIPDLRLHVSGCGDPERARKLFKRACYRNHIVVKFEPERFVPLVIREFARDASVTLTRERLPSFYTYSIESDDAGTPLLRIARNGVEPALLYSGPFFQFLLHGLTAPKERKRYNPLQSKAAKESRRLAHEQLLKQKVRKANGQLVTPTQQLTPLQLHLRNSKEREATRRGRIKLGAIRRHARKRKLRKITLQTGAPSTESDE